jgi:hypothetical protein
MLALRYVGLLALTLWVGGLLVLGAIAAPSLTIASLPARSSGKPSADSTS